jgi:hypothetical protein
MKGYFIIPVDYKGERLELKGKLLNGKHGYNFKVKVEGADVVFEQNEEGKYKVAVRPVGMLKEGKIDVELVEVIKDVVEKAEK